MSKLFYSRDEAKKRIKADKERQQARAELRGPMRWWLPKDQAGMLSFLDNPDFFVDEHRVKVDDSEVHLTCLAGRNGEGECPACDAGYKASFVSVCTVISHRPYTSKKDGVVHNHQKMLLVLKYKARDKVDRQIEKREGDLRFCVYEVARGGTATECATGEDFEYQGRTTKKKILQLKPKDAKETDDEWLKPYDYHKIFKALTVDEMKKLLGISPDSTVGSEDKEEETPDFSSKEDPDESEDDDGNDASESPAIGSDDDDEPEEKPKAKEKKTNGKASAKKEVDIKDLI